LIRQDDFIGFSAKIILLVFNAASRSLYSRKLWNRVHDQIVQEDKAVQEELGLRLYAVG
jgi:hypothetical protein